MDTVTLFGIAVIILTLGHVLVQVLFMFERKKYLKMIDGLTEKVMAKNYQDYTMGQALKDDEENEVVHRNRSDVHEAAIEKLHTEAENLEKLGNGLAEKLDLVNVGM